MRSGVKLRTLEIVSSIRSAVWCGSQNHHRDLRPGYGHLLRNFGGCAGGHNLQHALFPTCYGAEFIAKKVRAWIGAVGTKTAFIAPGSPWENGYCESFNARFRDELLNGEVFYSLREARFSSRNGVATTIRSGRTAHWDTVHQRPKASSR